MQALNNFFLKCKGNVFNIFVGLKDIQYIICFGNTECKQKLCLQENSTGHFKPAENEGLPAYF